MAKINLFLVVVVLALGVASAITPEEKKALREAATPIISACREEYGYSREDILAAKKARDFSALNPCFYACFFKKTGVINEAGLFDADAAMEKNKKYIKGEDDLKALTAIGQTCLSVNDESVTDGTNGCERSMKLLACLVKEKASYSPFILEAEEE